MDAVSSVTILGTRGSLPVQGADFQKYGGGTSCYLIRLAGETVVVDAGTGLSDLPRFLSAEQTRIQLLLTMQNKFLRVLLKLKIYCHQIKKR